MSTREGGALLLEGRRKNPFSSRLRLLRFDSLAQNFDSLGRGKCRSAGAWQGGSGQAYYIPGKQDKEQIGR